MNKTVNLTINGQAIEAKAGQTILEVATAAGIAIPTLCHHPALAPVGGCRVCLIEISKQQPLHPACTFRVMDGLNVLTDSPRVEKARRFVVELLFSERNHYCMFCEMSGDCELQNLGYLYGLDHWIYPTYTKAFPVDASRDTFLMDHNRCVLCRRCVRACDELVANHTLGARERGAKTMISADMNAPFGESSCISCGTCLQVCPTGALVDKRSAFMGRNLQTERIPSTCSQCSVGCGVEIVIRGGGILRVEGDWEAAPNGGLLCEKGRFAPLYDERERVTQPMVRRNGSLEAVGWDEALQAVAQRLSATPAGKVGVMTTTNATNEALYQIRTLFGQKMGVGKVGLLNGVLPRRLTPQGSLADLAEGDLIVVVGADPVADQPVASFLVKRTVDAGTRMILVGSPENALAPFAIMVLDDSEIVLAVEAAERAERPVVVYGPELSHKAAEALGRLERATFVALEPGVNTRAAVTFGLDHKFDPSTVTTLYVALGEQALDGGKGALAVPPGTFLIVQASYRSALTERADVVLPAAIWSERAGSLTNLEGRIRQACKAVEPKGAAKADWQIVALLTDKLGKGPAPSLAELTARASEQLA